MLRALLSLTTLAALIGCATTRDAGIGDRIALVEPYETITAAGVPKLKWPLETLAMVDPADPLAEDFNTQTLSLFGREDLIAATSGSYKPTRCAAFATAGDPLDEIVRRARATSVVIVNESHERSEHRGFSAQIAARLRPLGYDTLAIETLSNPQPDTEPRFLPAYVTRPDQPYFEDGDGYYLVEAGFGRFGRKAKALGYHFVPYEMNFDDGLPQDAPVARRIAVREEAQSSALARFIAGHPGVKLLVHVGYSHAREIPTTNGDVWMAARLKAQTGIDPLTISQTTCQGGSAAVHLAAAPAADDAGAFDLIVDHPDAHFVRGRPEWRVRAGDRPVTIPRKLRPTTGWRVIEARPVGEPSTSIPIDRVAIRAGEDIALMLPPGRYRLRAIDVPPSPKKSQP